jgi:serralysin
MDSVVGHHHPNDIFDSDSDGSDRDTGFDPAFGAQNPLAPMYVAYLASSPQSGTVADGLATAALTSTLTAPPITTDQANTVAYISGVSASGTVAQISYADWNGGNPATYPGTADFTNKWHNSSVGVTLDTTGFSAAGTAGGTVTYAFDAASGFTAAQETAYVAGLTLWSDEANIQFAPAASSASADVVFSLTSSGGTYEQGTPQYYATVGSVNIPDELTPTVTNGGQAQIVFNNSGPYGTIGSFTAQGGYGYSAMMHEMGHLMGLGHPGPYNDGSGTAGANLAPQLQFNAYDSRQWSLMSYIEPSDTTAAYYSSYTVTGTSWTSSTTVTSPEGGTTTTTYDVAPYTPMPLDILAVQRLYGAPVTTALSGGQVFGFHCNITDASEPFFDFTKDVTPVVTLWDAGSNNTLDLSGYSTAATINLNPGSFSSADGLTNNIGIAYGTSINTADGTSGSDTFIVNGANDTINGDGGTDTVDFNGTRASYTIVGNFATTSVTQNSTDVVDTLHNIADLQFTDQTVSVACYCRGTRVLSDSGEVAVEDLKIGDRLLTHLGEALPLRWIGRRAYAGRFAAANAAVQPVVIRAGALSDGVPARDLYVSPLHAMYLDEVLIPASALVNGTSIVQLQAVPEIEYFHLELATHAVIIAESALSESYLDCGNRSMFENAAFYDTLFPSAPRGQMLDCAPRVEHGARVDAVRARLAARAGATAAHYHLTQDLLLQSVGVSHFRVPAGVSRLRLLSSFGQIPGDRRPLGALLQGLELEGGAIDLRDRRLARGFHAPERHGKRIVRWTNGEAIVELAKTAFDRTIEVKVVCLFDRQAA